MECESKKLLMEVVGIDSFRRVSNLHPLNLYIGKDTLARPTLLLFSRSEPSHVFSSELIETRLGRRTDGLWTLSFTLSNAKYQDIFFHFCDDIIESSASTLDKDDGTEFVCSRYDKWQELFKRNSSGLLSFSEIKGLLGELIFMKEVLFEQLSKKQALESWIGPYSADQDFVCPDCWYEIKSVVSGAESVHISSIEQLDANNPGELVIVYLDRTSKSDPDKITLNNLIEKIINQLSSEDERRMLRDILLEEGYVYRDEYDEYVFKYSGYVRYAISQDFPSLRRSKISDSIINAQYTLSLASISKYIKEK